MEKTKGNPATQKPTPDVSRTCLEAVDALRALSETIDAGAERFQRSFDWLHDSGASDPIFYFKTLDERLHAAASAAAAVDQYVGPSVARFTAHSEGTLRLGPQGRNEFAGGVAAIEGLLRLIRRLVDGAIHQLEAVQRDRSVSVR